MFTWLRKMWWRGEVPPKPFDKDLDWPDEERWVFNYSSWKWEKALKETNPFNEGWEERWQCVAENDPVNLDEIPEATLVEEPKQCCGGICKLPPLPVNDSCGK